jgi:ribosomal protein S18 acetylase RimI-like enzyme
MVRPAVALVVRPRRPADADFVRALSDSAFDRWSSQPSRAVRAMMASAAARTLVAELDGEPVGFGMISVRRLDRPYGPIAKPASAHLDAIAVSERARGGGIGRLLLRHAERLARSEGAGGVFLMTAMSNRAARRMFERSGYLYLAALGPAYANAERAVMMMKPLT